MMKATALKFLGLLLLLFTPMATAQVVPQARHQQQLQVVGRQVVPQAWHQPITRQEFEVVGRIVHALQRSPEFPKVRHLLVFPEARSDWQFNAWEQNMTIFLPVEMLRLLENQGDPLMLAFLLAHEAGHAKQEELYGTSCYAATDLKMSKFDWFRSLADVVGAGITQGWKGAGTSATILQQQACEDHADVWAVRFTREAGIDPTGGIRLSNLFTKLFQQPGWQGVTQQFVANHSISPLRAAHVQVLIQKQLGNAPDSR
jgi:hypothetical protein